MQEIKASVLSFLNSDFFSFVIVMMRNTSHQTPMAQHLLDAIAPQDIPRPGGSRQHNKSRGEQNKGSGGGGGHTASATPNRGRTVVRRNAPGTGRSRGEGNTSSPRSYTADPTFPLEVEANFRGAAAATAVFRSTAEAGGPTEEGGPPTVPQSNSSDYQF